MNSLHRIALSALALASLQARAALAGDAVASGLLRGRDTRPWDPDLLIADADAATDVVAQVICATPEAASYFGFKCLAPSTPTSAPSPSTAKPAAPSTAKPGAPSPAPTPGPTVSKTATYNLHALAIGDWGVDLGLGSCCNKYRKTGVDNEAYYKDQQAQPNVAYLLAQSAQQLQPKVVIGHGDSFYWNGMGSEDVQYRFERSFEAMYSHPSLRDIKWVNVMGNHDYGGSMFICGKYDNQFHECASTADLLKQLDEKFTRQSKYVSPNGDRWKMPARYYVETLKDPASGVTVEIYNVDTNAATVHGGEQICCQCYGYFLKYGGDVKCNSVHRGHKYCAGGNNAMFDACLDKLKGWQDDALRQLARDAKASTATWKIVNSHYSPHFHMEPAMMEKWFKVLDDTGVQLFINGHTHAESHEYGDFKTHFVTNGAGGGIQSESIGSPPPYVTNVKTVWIGADAPYGFFELSFAKEQMRIRFRTFDENWKFDKNIANTVRGGSKVGHCWLIPVDGSQPAEAHAAAPQQERDERASESLVRAFLSLQERRVEIYRRFEAGFKQHQATAGFQSFCSEITLQFADVSAQINGIEGTLRSRGLAALADLLRRVQVQEKEKLVLTSALLVEKMRLADQARCPEPDDSVAVLLERSIVSMCKQQQAVIERINELLEEIRMELLELIAEE
ncbi:hypothetical protein ATCC90586_005976 [Pythium insidiosum]|nr:hypothetical protein ATCC90586_005976 [Pythium insidiosum]